MSVPIPTHTLGVWVVTWVGVDMGTQCRALHFNPRYDCSFDVHMDCVIGEIEKRGEARNGGS
ncbi:hypothetical protein KFK09_013063 [Dendrobium nobile]|uniref:Uncharacterized protein n=1 Tax=Dendrobium nobile TaxID=94219 RepID=A0A8T3BJ55_DENNO|nr:hypothetical protein KFK09_013063 [Dendrobium nobile]